LEQDAKASAMVTAQRLRPLGSTGGLSILKDYLHEVRTETATKRAYVRMEPGRVKAAFTGLITTSPERVLDNLQQAGGVAFVGSRLLLGRRIQNFPAKQKAGGWVGTGSHS